MQIETKQFYAYDIETVPAKLPLTLAETRLHLKLPINSEEAYLTILVETVRKIFEEHTNKTLINTTYKAFLDQFPSSYYNCNCSTNGILIAKAIVSSITSIKYYLDDVLTIWSSDDYSLLKKQTFTNVVLNENASYPTTVDSKEQAIEIIFVVGYGANETDIPGDIKMALLNHVAFLYQNRGDCGSDGTCQMPCTSKVVYEKHRIRSLGWGC